MTVSMAKCWIFLPVLIVILCTGSVTSSLTYCHRGSYYIPLGHTHACDLCGPGTFMPYHDHKETRCFDCMKIENDTLEILIEECNRTDDSVIHCVHGYFRRRPMNPQQKERCEKCTRCDDKIYEILPCRTFEDTHCCMEENCDVVPNQDGVPVCVERPWLCRRGKYFDTGNFLCTDCPSDTCMPLDYHSMTECIKCHSSSRENLPKHAIITLSCNKTHQAVVRCEDGYYINHTMGRYHKDIGCSPCKTCSSDDGMYKGRECGRAHNTVCCPQPNMTVVDTTGGPECRSSSTGSVFSSLVTTFTTTTGTPEVIICAEGQYLYIGDNNSNNCNNNHRAATCKPCPHGTFMDKTNHTMTECKDCTEVKGHDLPPSCPNSKIIESEEKDITGIAIGTLITGLVIGSLVAGVLCYVYNHRYFRRKRQQSDDMAEESELDGFAPLNKSNSTLKTSAEGQSMPNIKDTARLHQLDCEKHPMHPQFIPTKEFNRQDLPEQWREELVEKYVKATADLTVRVKVKFTHNDTPAEKTDPRRDASGMIYRVTRKFTEQDDTTCPCMPCQKTSTPKRRWGEVEVITSLRSVSNDDDAQRSTCTLWYDNHEDLSRCPVIYGVRVRYTIIDQDMCIMYCIIHEQEICKNLEQMVECWDRLRAELADKMKIRTNVQDSLTVIIAHPHQNSKHVTIGTVIRREEKIPYRFAYDAQTCLGSLGGPVSILGWEDGSGCLVTIHWGRREIGVNASSGFVLVQGLNRL